MFAKDSTPIVLGIVGPCAAGKSTLISELKPLGISSKHIAQEHSYVPDMWQRLVKPQHLVYLGVSYSESQRRRPTNMLPDEFDQQLFRLRHAYQHANLCLDTDQLSIAQVLQNVLDYLETQKST